MCISAWIWQNHPKYPLLLLTNRDEYHHRPTRPVEWWGEGDQKILGGRDEVAGGTWLGCTRSGRLALLTNFREPNTSSSAKSRGNLTLRFLQSHMSPLEYAKEIDKEATAYNGFNLVLADIHSKVMVYVSNRPEGEPTSVQIVSPGLHVLTNAKLDTPWPKALRLHEKFKDLLRRYGDEEIPWKKLVVKLMNHSVKADLNSLPITGYELEWEFKLSSIFVDIESKKALRLHEKLEHLLRRYGDEEIPVKELVVKLMNDSVKADLNNLPITGYEPEWEFQLSSIFVDIESKKVRYGTRSMSALSVMSNGEISFYERYLDVNEGVWKEHTVEYQMDTSSHLKEDQDI